jgi:hypothetical protein
MFRLSSRGTSAGQAALRRRLGGLAGLMLIATVALPAATAPPAAVSFRNGYALPVQGDIRMLVAFAEVNFLPCGGGSTQGAFAHANWPEGQLPLDKDQYLDVTIQGTPSAYLTDYYYQMSFGRYRVTGDYFAGIVTLDCRNPHNDLAVIQALNARPPWITAHGLSVTKFDEWTLTSPGQPKLNQPDGLIDVFMIVWRNYDPYAAVECAGCFSGYMPTTSMPGRIGPMTGFDRLASFEAWGSGRPGWGVFIHEYMHALFGGNNWHIGDGADVGSFHSTQSPWGMTAHSPAPSNVANGWDRDHLGWSPADKRHTISALNRWRREEPSDISIASHPAGALFLLRDFVETGDAVRIKLPHLAWEEFAPKNQYLWLENHQIRSRFDSNFPLHPCQPGWTPGMYAYVQVGKDTGATDINHDGVVDATDLFPDSVFDWYPNALGSWLLPLSADGRRDWLYRLDKATPGDPYMPCQWDNAAMPVEIAMSLPNPFTGYSDLFFSADVDAMLAGPGSAGGTLIPFGNGLLHSGEPRHVLAEVVNEAVVRQLGRPDRQAFSARNGYTKLSLATNPAPVPVYTLRSGAGYATPYLGAIEEWENRTIWLNGLSVEILEENADGRGAMLVRVRWDETLVDHDVRWTGQIVLQNDADDPWHRQSKIVVDASKHVYLDRGLSPTREAAAPNAEFVFPFGRASVYPSGLRQEYGRLFTAPTVFTMKNGTKIHLRRNARLWVQNGSTFQVEVGAQVQLEPGAKILAGAGGGILNLFGDVRPFGDLDGNACVDREDFALLVRETFWGPRDPFHDLTEDGRVDLLDAWLLTTFYTNRFGRPCPDAPAPVTGAR